MEHKSADEDATSNKMQGFQLPRRTPLFLLSISALLVVASCSAENVNPQDPTPDTQASQSSLNGSSELKIDKPKNLKSIKDACTALTPGQLETLQQDGEADPEQTLYGESKCTWFGDKFATTVSLGSSANKGPAKIYEDGKFADNFKPTKVDGYPAGRIDDQGTMCTVEVGIADDQFFAVDYAKKSGKGIEFENGCEFAEKIASEVLKNIPDARPK